MSDDADDIRMMVKDALNEAMQRKRSLPEMAARVAEYCNGIEASQIAWITGGLYMRPDPREIERLADMQQLYNFLEACRTQPAKVAARLNKVKAA